MEALNGVQINAVTTLQTCWLQGRRDKTLGLIDGTTHMRSQQHRFGNNFLSYNIIILLETLNYLYILYIGHNIHIKF